MEKRAEKTEEKAGKTELIQIFSDFYTNCFSIALFKTRITLTALSTQSLSYYTASVRL